MGYHSNYKITFNINIKILNYSQLRLSIKMYLFHALETFLARIPRKKNIST